MQIPDDLHELLMKRSQNDFEDFGHVEITPKKDVNFVFLAKTRLKRLKSDSEAIFGIFSLFWVVHRVFW